MTVAELIEELQKMPQDAWVYMWVNPAPGCVEVHSVEKRYDDMIFLNDEYYTPYAEEDEK